MTEEQGYAVVIADLDDTLFDWVGLWHKCFSVMLDGVLGISRLDQENPRELGYRPSRAAVHVEDVVRAQLLACVRTADTAFGDPAG